MWKCPASRGTAPWIHSPNTHCTFCPSHTIEQLQQTDLGRFSATDFSELVSRRIHRRAPAQTAPDRGGRALSAQKSLTPYRICSWKNTLGSLRAATEGEIKIFVGSDSPQAPAAQPIRFFLGGLWRKSVYNKGILLREPPSVTQLRVVHGSCTSQALSHRKLLEKRYFLPVDLTFALFREVFCCQ